MMTGNELSWVVACYVMGCLTMGYYLVKWRTGADLRQQGSGNLGARNVGRILGKPGFAITLLGDVCKGLLAVGVARWMEMGSYAVLGAMVAVVAGHIWPLQLRFQGGKGVAVSLGALLAYDPPIVLIIVFITLPALLMIRSFTLAGMLAYCSAPFVVFLLDFGPLKTLAALAVSMLVMVAHRGNIREELSGFWADRSAKQMLDHPPD